MRGALVEGEDYACVSSLDRRSSRIRVNDHGLGRISALNGDAAVGAGLAEHVEDDRCGAAKAQGQYVVVLTSSDRAEILERIVALLKESGDIKASVTDQAFYGSGKAALGDWWKSNETRFTLKKA